jgi:hypothetical protein
VLVVGPPVDVDDIARGMLHGLRLCAATRQHWSAAQRGGRGRGVAKQGRTVGGAGVVAAGLGQALVAHGDCRKRGGRSGGGSAATRWPEGVERVRFVADAG